MLENLPEQPLPDTNRESYKEIFSHEDLSKFPEHKRWEAALVYMIMSLSNQIHTVITSTRGNRLPVPDGNGGWTDKLFPWSEDRKKEELDRLERLLDCVNDLTDDLCETYFPFTGSGCPASVWKMMEQDDEDDEVC